MNLGSNTVKFMIAFLVVVSVATAIYLGSGDEIQKALPPGSRISKVYRRGGWGNGDFVYALKANMALKGYTAFVKSRGLTDEAVDPFSVIGYNRSIDDLPADEKNWWDEPSHPQLKYYRMYPRSFVRASYHNGFLYYFSQGW